MPVGMQMLESVRITETIQQLQDVRELPQQLVFSAGVPDSPSFDGEILARYTGRVLIADLIADDQVARVQVSGKLAFETTSVPNIKHGRHLTQEQINQLMSLQNMGMSNDPFIAHFTTQIADELLLGIRQRKEALIIAMQLDSLTYDGLGIKMSGVTWGMPNDLKVTSSIAWDHVDGGGVHDGTPITDCLVMRRLGMIRYGITYDRIRMSTAAFDFAVQTKEFIDQSKALLVQYGAVGVTPQTQNIAAMQPIFERLIGMTIELYDGRYWYQTHDGTIASANFLPITKVVFSSRADDGNRDAMDFANSVVTESVISQMAGQLPGVIGRIPAGVRGPIAYVTIPPNLNPPEFLAWGVARGFPRKKKLFATAVLTVGAFQDPIAVGEPF